VAHHHHHHHHHHQISQSSHSINSIGPAPHRGGRKRAHGCDKSAYICMVEVGGGLSYIIKRGVLQLYRQNGFCACIT
jgi:hypothetical protein